MARYLFRLPDIGEGVAEAEIVAWHVTTGDVVAEDQSLADVMTDKATVDLTSPVDGRVVAVHGAIGDAARVGSVLVELEIGGDEPEPAPPTEPAPPPPIASAPLAAPATRKRAGELGIALGDVPATGRNGRITPEDLEAFADTRKPAAAAPGDAVIETRISGLRRRIADAMQEAKRRIPHISYVEECDLTELERLRADLNAHRADGAPKLTLLPFLMRALVKAVADFPQMNAHFDDEGGVLRSHRAVHIGIATQTDGGLMVPVVRDAETRDLWSCAAEVRRVSAAARAGKATRDELSGSTITLTSLGPLGGIVTTPIVNRPETAILAPNRLVDRPVVEGAFVTVRKMMNLSSSFDHRIVDGHDAARFVQRLRRLLEHPALIFLDEPPATPETSAP